MMRVALLAAGLLTACQLVAPLRPAGPATWSLPSDQEIGPETAVFTALVTEVDCASGQSSEGRVVGPDITYGSHDVIITFAVRPLRGDAQECPGNPATPVEVTLSEPLRDRVLIDGGADPPREPSRCDQMPFCS